MTRYSYLYLFKDDRDNYKIGISDNPKARLDQIKAQNPSTKIVLTSKYIGDEDLKAFVRKDEKELHRRFKHKNIFGEWFKLSKKDIVRIWKFMGFAEDDFRNWIKFGGKESDIEWR